MPTIFPNCPKYISKNVQQKRRTIIKHEGVSTKRLKLCAKSNIREVETVENLNASTLDAGNNNLNDSLNN